MSLILSLSFFALKLYSHPVAFKDSVGIMGYHSPLMTHNQVNYSFRHWFALGAHHLTRPLINRNNRATLLSGNLLLKRWNAENLQANIYMNFGLGQSDFSGKSTALGYGLVQFDIEDRKYYFLSKHEQLLDEKQTDFKQSTVRLGFTPYLDGFEGIHSWLILEYQHLEFAGGDRQEQLTPFLRIFYRNLLFEIGQSLKGMTMFNYITHF